MPLIVTGARTNAEAVEVDANSASVDAVGVIAAAATNVAGDPSLVKLAMGKIGSRDGASVLVDALMSRWRAWNSRTSHMKCRQFHH